MVKNKFLQNFWPYFTYGLFLPIFQDTKLDFYCVPQVFSRSEYFQNRHGDSNNICSVQSESLRESFRYLDSQSESVGD